MVNDTELAWLGYERSELLGRSFRDLVLTGVARTDAAFPAFKRDGELRDSEVELRRKDGTVLSVIINATAIWMSSAPS